MNTGVEAGETAVKLARKWAYKVKGECLHSVIACCCITRSHAYLTGLVFDNAYIC
jgi:4-aminobutyrate aminotransferase-like enzyme